MSEFNYPMWIEVVFWSIPLLIYMWILGMWANAKDNQPEEEKEEMTFIRALGTTLLCVLVGVVGVGGGSWYTTKKLFNPLIKEDKKRMKEPIVDKIMVFIGWIAVSPFVIRDGIIFGFKWLIRKIKRKN